MGAINNNLVQKLKAGDQQALKTIYLENKSMFINYLRRYDLDEETLNDIYQDAVVALYENARKGSIDDLKSTISTYLIGIGKFMCLNKHKKNKREVFFDNDEAMISDEGYEEIALDHNTEATERQQLISKHFEQLGQKCKEILNLFYLESLTIAEIMEVMGYESQNVVKASKSRCLKTLKSLING